MSTLNPYLGFRDNAREVMDFYHSVFGGELTQSTFGELQGSDDPAEQDKIMHSQLETPSGFTLMAADTPNSLPYTPGDNITISLSGSAAEGDELRGYWHKLVDGGTVTMKMDMAPWGDEFGMCVDRFGIGWLVNIAGPES
jgi:PhnB protein